MVESKQMNQNPTPHPVSATATQIIGPFSLHDSLRRISKASTVEEVKSKCRIERALLEKHGVKLPVMSLHNDAARTDHISQQIIQKYHPSLVTEYRPLLTEADGNCLYRATSSACFGTEDHHILLRLLTLLEMAEHSCWYDTEDSGYCYPFQGSNCVPLDDYRNYLSRTSYPGTQSDINHILALSAVLGIPIHSYFPPGSPAQSKPMPTPTTPTSAVPAPLLSLMSTATTSVSTASVSNLAPVPSQNQTGTLLLKTTPANSVANQSTPPTPQQPVSLQPLLIQLPLTVANSQGGAVMANHSAGVELMSSLSTANTLSKAKTTTPATTFILQNTCAPALPPSPSLPQMTLARAVYPGGSGAVSVPSSGVSVSTARTLTGVVGVTSSVSLPTSSAPAATGGQSTGSAGSGPPSVTTMASKTDNQATNSTTNNTPAQVSRTSSSGAVIDLTEDDDDIQVTGVKKAPVQLDHSAAAATFSSPPLFSAASSAPQRSAGPPPPLISSTSVHGPATGATVRSSPQSGVHSMSGPQLTVHCRPPQDSSSKPRGVNATTGASGSVPHPLPPQYPPLPSPPPPPGRLPPEATHTSPPQQPQLKLARVQSQNGIVLSWSVAEVDRSCAAVESYHLYAYHQDHSGGGSLPSQWKKIGEVKALPLPMACTLTQFVSGSTYYFAVCARDVYSRFGPFCEPQCTDVISPTSS